MADDDDPLTQETHIVLTPADPRALGAARAMVAAQLGGDLAAGWATRLADEGWVLAPRTVDRLVEAGALDAAVDRLRDIADMTAVDVLDGVALAARLATAPPLEDETPAAAPAGAGLWQRRAVHADEAIAFVQDAGADLASVRVAQIDTGATHHAGLDAAGGAPGTNVLWDEGHGFFGPATPDDRLDYNGIPGHGTRIMSVISSPSCGTVPGLSIVPLRSVTSSLFDEFWFTPSRVPLAFSFAAGVALGSGKRMDPADVINISLGDPFEPRVKLCKAIDRCYADGIIVVAAAGQIIKSVVYPARFSRTIAAGGATPGDNGADPTDPNNLAPWDNASRGPAVTISAPAKGITRLNVTKEIGDDDLTFAEPAGGGEGTSYATAIITAAAALWVALHRDRIDALKAAGEGWKVVEAFRAALTSTAVTPAGWDVQNYGAGILDMAALVRLPFDDALRDVTEQETAVEEG